MLGPDDVADALGPDRLAAMHEAVAALEPIRALTWHAATTDFVCRPLSEAEVAGWQRRKPARGVGVRYPPEPMEGVEPVFYVMDEASDAGLGDPEAATIYPSVHSMMTSWWLVHAWRVADLIEDASLSLQSWRVTSAAVAARSLIEETGCLLYEADRLSRGWSTAKSTADAEARGMAVFELVRTVLAKAAFGTRMKEPSKNRSAPSVLNYRDILIKKTGDTRYGDWYEWLTETAHPAYGARVAYSGPALGDGAILVRSYAKQPIWLEERGRRVPSEHPVADRVLDAVTACATACAPLLQTSLALVDDFGLTTAAGTLTRRTYFRQFAPQRGRRQCPCGCGAWSDSMHFWGKPAPAIAVAD